MWCKKTTRSRLMAHVKRLQLRSSDVLLCRLLDYAEAHPEVLEGRVH